MLVGSGGPPEVAGGRKVTIWSSRGPKGIAREGRPSSSPGFLNLGTFHISDCNLISDVASLWVCRILFVRSSSLHLGAEFTQARMPVGGDAKERFQKLMTPRSYRSTLTLRTTPTRKNGFLCQGVACVRS